MATFDLKDLITPKKIIENVPWIAVGAIGAVIVWTWFLGRTVAPAGAIGVRSPYNVGTYHTWPEGVQTPTYQAASTHPTPTYGCASCGQTGSMGVHAASERMKFY